MTNSSQGRQAQPTSNELDLDALERKLREPDDFAFDGVDISDLILALIQRLREAERRITDLRNGWEAQIEHTKGLHQRIAALERVREAASTLCNAGLDAAINIKYRTALIAALAAVPTAHNNEGSNGK